MWLDGLNISVRRLAKYLNISPSTVAGLINSEADILTGMAIRLSKVFGRTPQSWLAIQYNYSVW